jgi:chromosome segregation ATPase
MNKSYVIVPVVLLAVFGFLYRGALQDMDAKQKALAAQAALVQETDAKRKKEVEDKANIDAQKRQEQRAAEDLAKAEKKQREYDDIMKKLKDESTDYSAQSVKFSKEAADLEQQITQTRNEREKLNREALELSKQVELAKINRRNAELEIQRTMEMVAVKLNESSIATPPPPPLPKK